MTNLPDFLRSLLARGRNNYNGKLFLSEEELAWVESYLTESVDEVHFRAKPTGREVDGEPEMEQHMLLRGEEFNVYMLVCEAALHNKRFFRIIQAAAGFADEHFTQCSSCQQQLHDTDMTKTMLTWEFKPLKNCNEDTHTGAGTEPQNADVLS